MTREQLEHIIRASAAIISSDEVVIIGSQSILGAVPLPPSPVLTRSIEADVFTFRSPEDAAVIEGAIGEGSLFHNTFGYYAHGVGEETAVLPPGWKQRLIRVQTPATRGATGLCLDPKDLAAAKLAAGRESDLEFVREMLVHKVVSSDALRERAAALPPPHQALALERLKHLT